MPPKYPSRSLSSSSRESGGKSIFHNGNPIICLMQAHASPEVVACLNPPPCQNSPAFAQILPALFGGLGVAFVSKNWKISIAPVLLMLALFIFVPALGRDQVGIMVPVSAVFTIIVSRILYKKGVL